MRLRDLATWPGALTLLRLVIAAAAPAWVGWHAAWFVYLFAIGTDVADGWLARRLGCASRTGAAFDAWVDKTLHVNLGWALAVADRMPDWYLAAWCARELIQGPSVVFLAHRFRTATAPPPRTSNLGRATAFTLFAAVLQTLAGSDALVLTVVTGVLGTLSGIHYMAIYLPRRPLPVPDRPEADPAVTVRTAA